MPKDNCAALESLLKRDYHNIKLNDIFTIQYIQKNTNYPRNINFYLDNYKGNTIVRAVAYLSNTGCEWSIKTGGCTMCGTKNNRVGRKLSDSEFIAQISEVKNQIEKYNASHNPRVQTLHIYNDGMFLNDFEIGENARKYIYRISRELDMKKLVVETSVNNIMSDNRTDNHLAQGVKDLGETEFEITLGIESTNPLIRKLYNKPTPDQDVLKAIDVIKNTGAFPKAYVLVKGPLLTEREAYEDCINTIKTLLGNDDKKTMRIELQPTCILPNTLHEFLMNIDKSDPYHWEPPLISTVLRIINEFPKNNGNLYSALFARFDQELPWSFWSSRPHDTESTTFPLYKNLVEYYITRNFNSISSALDTYDKGLSQKRFSKTVPHTLEKRIEAVKKIVGLSKKNNMFLSDYLKQNLQSQNSKNERNDNFIDACLKL
ncbi:MAG: hypothetical protein PHH54_03330 [Candidatus Nanoarchaeia archaeon]|nr:hypothetical protein [Candidatus Nanoarchaeia archaeon]MDD5740989.1 hypothetical protein [Candidatus Nanoarchaeia archaeon]